MSSDNPKYSNMVKRKNDQYISNRKAVFAALKRLAKPSTSTQIHAQVNDNRSLDYNQMLKSEIAKEEKISLRTVQRQLRKLEQEGFVVYEKKLYSFSNMERPAVKMHANEFGTALLFSAMKRICPHYSRLEYNITRLVEIIGVYMIYCFLEASKASPTINLVEGKKRDELTISWVKSMLDTTRMFYYFVTLAKTQLGDKEVREIRKRVFKKKNGIYIFSGDIEEYTCSLANFMIRKVGRYFIDDLGKKNKRSINSILECDPEFIDKVKRILSERYEMVFQEMENAYNLFDITSKDGTKQIGPKLDFTPEESLHGVWNSEVLENIPEWDSDLVN
jgi:DNA-binding transcriptional regulator YhcF (GntR family)